MSDNIVTRLMRVHNDTISQLKESMSLYEAEDDEEESGADEEYLELNDESDDAPNEDTEAEETPEEDSTIEDDSTAPEQGTPDTPIPSHTSLGDFSADEEPTEDAPKEKSPEKNEKPEEYENPLDNQYAVHYTLGDEIALSFNGDTQDRREGFIDGYDIEGFYRVKWTDGTTTNGLTDIALEELVRPMNECVCGHGDFVEEDGNVICDRCGRLIKENASLLDLDKSRPKGKRLIRSEAHPISTAVADRPSIAESIRKAFSKSQDLNESGQEGEFEEKCTSCDTTSSYTEGDIHKDHITSKFYVRCKHPNCNSKIFIHRNINEEFVGSIFDKLKTLDNEFWTRQNELVEDIEELGYTVDEINGEYVVVSSEEDDMSAYLVPISGTSRTMTLDFSKAREI